MQALLKPSDGQQSEAVLSAAMSLLRDHIMATWGHNNASPQDNQHIREALVHFLFEFPTTRYLLPSQIETSKPLSHLHSLQCITIVQSNAFKMHSKDLGERHFAEPSNYLPG